MKHVIPSFTLALAVSLLAAGLIALLAGPVSPVAFAAWAACAMVLTFPAVGWSSASDATRHGILRRLRVRA